jgi:hypothetical protein
MAVTETRLLPKSLVNECHHALARLRLVRDIDKDHPVIPTLPHPIDCDICTAGRLVDILIDEITKAIGNAAKVSKP